MVSKEYKWNIKKLSILESQLIEDTALKTVIFFKGVLVLKMLYLLESSWQLGKETFQIQQWNESLVKTLVQENLNVLFQKLKASKWSFQNENHSSPWTNTSNTMRKGAAQLFFPHHTLATGLFVEFWSH